VRVIPVPGTAGGIRSRVFMRRVFMQRVFMRQGFVYKMTATGSIRVGVFGETGTRNSPSLAEHPLGARSYIVDVVCSGSTL
jgi:hypothetical protein